jgi:nucleoside 2-deoxyribosyltransferase
VRSQQAILDLIAQGESETVELKQSLPPSAIIAKHLAAFANSRGGYLIVGVSRDGHVVGLPEEEAQQAVQTLSGIGDSMFSRPIDVAAIDVGGKIVVYAAIVPTSDSTGPVLTAKGELYERHGNSVRKLSEQEEREALHPGVKNLRVKTCPCTAFVAMSFREEEEPALVDYFRAMERAVDRTKLPIVLKRIDLVEGDYEISQRLMAEIDNADMVIADLTLNPHNVYFELGYARGTGKRIIQTARKGATLEFDVRNWRTSFYRNATELEDKLVPELIAAYADITNQKASHAT